MVEFWGEKLRDDLFLVVGEVKEGDGQYMSIIPARRLRLVGLLVRRGLFFCIADTDAFVACPWKGE